MKRFRIAMLKSRALFITIVTAGLLAVFILVGCSAGTTSSPSEPSQVTASTVGQVSSSSGGSVTIDAKLLGHQDNSLVFEVAMNTHSVDLDGYDLKQLALLRDDKGGEYRPIEWDSAQGGHHRSGKLVFEHPDQSSKSFELIIRDVAGVSERVLRWQVS